MTQGLPVSFVSGAELISVGLCYFGQGRFFCVCYISCFLQLSGSFCKLKEAWLPFYSLHRLHRIKARQEQMVALLGGTCFPVPGLAYQKGATGNGNCFPNQQCCYCAHLGSKQALRDSRVEFTSDAYLKFLQASGILVSTF